MSSGHVNHLVHGRRPITPRLVLQLAKAVQVSAHWLETGEGHPDDVDAPAAPGVSRDPDVATEMAALVRENRALRELNRYFARLGERERGQVLALMQSLTGEAPRDAATTLLLNDRDSGAELSALVQAWSAWDDAAAKAAVLGTVRQAVIDQAKRPSTPAAQDPPPAAAQAKR